MVLTFCVTSPPRIYSQSNWLAKRIYPRLLLVRCLTMIILDFAGTPEKVVVEQKNIFSNFGTWQNFCGLLITGEHSTTEPTMLDGCEVTLYCKISTRKAVVAEWLRRLTRNQFPSGSVGSNPTNCVKDYFGCLWGVFSLSTISWATFEISQPPIPR